MKTIPLTQGKFALVDDEDYEFLVQWKWYFDCGYARRNIKNISGKRSAVRMHRVILKTEAPHIDHINGDGLDNQKQNLRPSEVSQNCMNRRKIKGAASSKYKGVCLCKKSGKFRAYIRLQDKKRVCLGRFETETLAAKAYNIAAKQYFGEFAKTNALDSKQ